MTLARTADLVDGAVSDSGAVLAVNVVTLEQAEGVIEGATRAGRGVIIQLSENAIRFHGGRMTPLLLACRELAETASVPVALHLDHMQDLRMVEEALREADRCGVSSLMIDVAHAGWDENVATTAHVLTTGRAIGLWVEAELGVVGGKDGAHAPGVRTDPDDAAAFVTATEVDALAVAVGSSHAMISREAVLDLGLIATLRDAVPVPLVLHGSSGVPDEVLRAAVEAGIRKVNVGTALSIAFTRRVLETMAASPDVVDPRRYLAPARDAVAEIVAQCIGVIAGR